MSISAELQSLQTKIDQRVSTVTTMLAQNHSTETLATLNTLKTQLTDLKNIYAQIETELGTYHGKIESIINKSLNVGSLTDADRIAKLKGYDTTCNQDPVCLEDNLKQFFIDQIKQILPAFPVPANLDLDVSELSEILTDLRACPTAEFAQLQCIIGLLSTHPALELSVREQLRVRIGEVTETDFDNTGIALQRLHDIFEGLVTSCSSSGYSTACIVGIANTYPELDQIIQYRLDAISNEIKSALQANPNTDISSLATTYQTTIENAYGVMFTKDLGTTNDWSVIAIHFVRKGLETIAKAFEQWANDELANPLQNLEAHVNRFMLFQRVMGQMTFVHKGQPQLNFAQSSQNQIEIFERPRFINYYQYDGDDLLYPSEFADGSNRPPPFGDPDNLVWAEHYDGEFFGDGNLVTSGRQAVMSPNLVIHELGHSFSRFSGFKTANDRGTIEYAIDAGSYPYLRTGMGEIFLQQYFENTSNAEYYEHGSVTNNGGVAMINVTPNLPPTISTPQEREIHYLCYDLLGEEHYSLWNNSNYNPYIIANLPRIRIDFHVHNASATALETSADAFLNWVRDKLQKLDSTDPDWDSFFQTHIGIFLRNGVMFQQGSLEHYQRKGDVPVSSIASGSVINDYRVRITPEEETTSNVFGYASDNDIGLYEQTAQIYGWTDRVQTQADSSPNWLLVLDSNTRLLWIASNAISGVSGELNAGNKINDVSALYLSEAYDPDYDLQTILGV